MNNTDILKKAEKVFKKLYPQVDSIGVSFTKTDKLRITFMNDYPLQHGSGEQLVIPKEFD